MILIHNIYQKSLYSSFKYLGEDDNLGKDLLHTRLALGLTISVMFSRISFESPTTQLLNILKSRSAISKHDSFIFIEHQLDSS